ncbi:GNAT family N-acetyltransferase [Leekyejoonella antrihumi]|uniref:GNAT family N-acetyltransferase n=1 Tax=Leekyejoonella antrihumi TaxID=1660198 RepID=A0A563E3E4_9MICO|nr:GNAT family N-acetyltransferase [Leekyejoonella antrihumi]TWP36829.1 GNAT family N-acetyltransferase [Leekyejoonella antrihumi]
MDERRDGSVREISATGHQTQVLATELLQRARRADPTAGLWEAADVQWWSRRPRRSDEVEKIFWVDDQGPVAGILLTSWGEGPWQCDPVVVPGARGPELERVWRRAVGQAAKHSSGGFEIPVRDDDQVCSALAQQAGFATGEHDSTAWMEAADRPPRTAPPEGFVVVDRSQRPDAPHPMRDRNGDGVAQRLDECSLYDPALDLAVEAVDGRIVGYSLYWFDPTTKVGLVEPVRVEDEFQRKGLAGTMLREGVERLTARGAERVKVSFGSEAAGAVYKSVGFRPMSTATWYVAPSTQPQCGMPPHWNAGFEPS